MNRLLALCAISLAVCPLARATVIDFEGILSDNTDYWGAVPDGYRGFRWSPYFYVLDVSRFPSPQGGYGVGLASGKCVGYTAWALPVWFWKDGETFSLNSLVATAAWNRELQLSIVGYRNGLMVRTTTVELDTRTQKLITLNWSDLDMVRFESQGGVQDPELSFLGEHAVFDDIRVNETAVPAVPAPAAALPFLAGLLARRRRRSR